MADVRREWLIKLRKNHGFTQESLGETISIDAGTVGRWERGAQDIRIRNQAALSQALGLSMSQLLDLLGPRTRQEASPKAEAGDVSSTEALSPGSASPVESLRSVIDGCRGLDHRIGPQGTLDIVRSQLVVARQLGMTSRNQNEQRQLQSLTAQIHQLAGWMSFDARDMEAARDSFAEARTAAGAVEDPALLAYVLGPSAAFAEADTGDPAQGLDLVYAAQGWARRAGNQRLLAFVFAITARVHAKLGDEQLTRQALDDAAEALALHDGWEADPVWLEVFDETALLGHTGSCDLDLGRPEQAVELLDRQDLDSAEIFVRNRAIWRLDRATAFRNMNELDQACNEIGEGLDLIGATSSPRTRHKLQVLTDSLTSDPRPSTSAKQLVERLNDHPVAQAIGISEVDESTGR